jgi:hypothetical protein
MKISSGATSYLYDIHRDAGQKRRFDDVVSRENNSRLIEGKREQKISPPVEQVVEGEYLGHRFDTQIDDVLKFTHTSSDKPGSKASHALEQYRVYGFSDNVDYNAGQGRQIDYYV